MSPSVAWWVAPLLDCPRPDRPRLIEQAHIGVDAAGRISHLGGAAPQTETRPTELNGLIIPGLIDAHTHWAQYDAIDQPAGPLLAWLDQYIFPIEEKLEDESYAADLAERFMRALLAAGTTSAVMFGSIHARAAEIGFQTAERLGLRAVMGKMMMDENCPPPLRERTEDSLRESEQLIRRWHGRHGRLFYALSPRYALCCSRELMAAAGALARKHDAYVQTHLAENVQECRRVGQAYPEAAHYTDVYLRDGLLGPRTLVGHAIHLDPQQRDLLARTDTRVVHCPSANLFLDSGAMDYRRGERAGLTVALGSDVAAGTSLSMLAVARDAIKVSRSVGGVPLSAAEAFYLATVGGAAALGWQDQLGTLEPGKWADFVLLDGIDVGGDAVELTERLIGTADGCNVKAVYIGGRCRYTRRP